MKMYVLGSNSFLFDMIKIRDELVSLGYNGWLHPHYDEIARGERPEQVEAWKNNESYLMKIKYDYIRQHYQHILKSDSILIVNLTKNGISNYIGGNVLIEMGQAYVNDKKIYFLNDMPSNLPYQDEIIAMFPICLHGDLRNIG